MAADPFTNTNGTALSAHTAAGNTWSGAGQADAGGLIQGNVACADASEYFSVSARATNSTVPFSQAVIKAGTYPAESKAVCVRASASSQGYWLHVYAVTGDTITTLMLMKADTFLTAVEGLSLSRLVDHTLALKATTVGSDVQLQAWVDGSPATFSKTDWDNETPSTTFTDLASETPILTGNPGFLCYSFDGISAANSAFDDWTDVEPTGGGDVEVGDVTPDTMRVAQVGVVIDGEGFEAAQGSGNVVICPSDDVDDVNGVVQTTTAWGDTEITINVVRGTLSLTDALYLFVINDSGGSNAAGFPVAIDPAVAALAFGAGLLD